MLQEIIITALSIGAFALQSRIKVDMDDEYLTIRLRIRSLKNLSRLARKSKVEATGWQ